MRVTERPAVPSSGGRDVSFERGAPFTPAAIVARGAIGREPRPGPLIIDEFDATIVVPPDAVVRRDAIGAIVMEIGGSS
jgi:N-methylhydantoinase A